MNRRRTVAAASAGLLGLALVAGVAAIGPSDFFLPERSTQANETLIDAGPTATTTTAVGDGTGASTTTTATGPDGLLKRGTFTGVGHEVSGTVELVRQNGSLYLQFRNYEQEQGPDVFVYLTPSPTPDTESEVGAGRKLLIPGGADGGESTVEGDFLVQLPDSVSAGDVDGVAVWCERFGVPFGYASLNATGADA